MVPRFFGGIGTPEISGQGSRGAIPGARQVARPLVGERQGARGTGGEREAAVEERSPMIELAEVHVAETKVVEEIGILGIMAEEILQIDAGFVRAEPKIGILPYKKTIYTVSSCYSLPLPHESESRTTYLFVNREEMGMVTELETIEDSSYILSILEERLGDFSKIMTDYDIVILPAFIGPSKDLLSPNTASIKGLIKTNGLRPAIAVKEPHVYLAQYSSDPSTFPILITLGDLALTIALGIISCYIYDNYIKSSRSDTNIKIKYINYNIGNKNFVAKNIEGPAKEVLELINNHIRR